MSSTIAAAAKTPPKFVIRARTEFKPSSPIELSFKRGDFFLVVNPNPPTALALGRPPDPPDGADAGLMRRPAGVGPWLEVMDPLRNVKGLVPSDFFDVIERTGHAHLAASGGGGSVVGMAPSSPVPTSGSVVGGNGYSAAAAPSLMSPAAVAPAAEGGARRPSSSSPPLVYPAVVQYDFEPENPDELHALAGDHVLVLAHSGFEWVVAKFIGKLGNPGLIPISYLQIRDPITNAPYSDFAAQVLQQGRLLSLRAWKARQQALAEHAVQIGPGSPLPAPVSMNGHYSYSHASHGHDSLAAKERAPARISSRSQSYAGSDLPDGSAVGTNLPPPPLRTRGSLSAGAVSRDVSPSPTSATTTSTTPSATGYPRVAAATVPSFEPRGTDYVYAIHATRIDHAKFILYRTSDALYDIHLQLTTWAARDPDMVNAGVPLPSWPDDVPVGVPADSDAVATARRYRVDAYLSALLAHPLAARIASHPAVAQFFRPRAGDKIRRPSTRAAAAAAASSSSPAPPLPSTGPPQPQPAALMRMSPASSVPASPVSANAPGGTDQLPPPGMPMQPPPATPEQQPLAHHVELARAAELSLKIKIVFGHKVIAIRCNPHTITHASLLAKIAEKLFNGDIGSINRLVWRRPAGGDASAPEFVDVEDEDELARAVAESGEKMLLYVQ
ncbi:hypothetical protein AMAG_02161 [Allomyces macrogynus ATCC 38327]|uniref:SH3 domain-containing protein n=1 Tax=Allomyces macrogynus (strain ATCC 38327) TaxID=578462 RepID=A0A0L0S1Q9_ALLM3|nr:hypothetical protein AMAG_02161 [Allomyces macrogynus ATCC 38327]|eukprot:KNE56341.1 hypothetical protein AMAG_02161 [Allomyces macrogynus ATCC 38327]